MENNYILDDDEDPNVDVLTKELIEVDKIIDNTTTNKTSNEEKKEIIIEITIDSLEDDDDLDFIDDDFEYIDEENVSDSEDDTDTE